ncbi:hypothetical protein QOT17_025485 [Balamuthia mandrillaris]
MWMWTCQAVAKTLTLSLSISFVQFTPFFPTMPMPLRADMTSHRENKVLSYAFNVFLSAFTPYFLFLLFFCVSATKVLLHPTLPLARCRNNCLRYDPAPALRQAGQLLSPSAQQLPTTYDLRPTTYDLRPPSEQLSTSLRPTSTNLPTNDQRKK